MEGSGGGGTKLKTPSVFRFAKESKSNVSCVSDDESCASVDVK